MECNMSEKAENQQGEDVYLPPGFRFHPTDEELLNYYLRHKALDRTFSAPNIAEVDLNKCEPWDLPEKAKIDQKERYFFSVRDKKYRTGLRTNRATAAGYWKATGKDREIFVEEATTSTLIGMKKTLVFYTGRAPKGEKTSWVMHEYRLAGKFSCYNLPETANEEWVVSRVFKKNAPGAGKKVLSGLSITCQNDLDSAALPWLSESPSLNPNVANEGTPSLESDSGFAVEHVSCFSSPVEPLKDYNVEGFPGQSPYDRQREALAADIRGISETTNIMRPWPYPQTIMQLNDSLLNINATSGIFPFCNVSRQDYAAQLSPHNTLYALPSYPNAHFPACNNINTLYALPSYPMDGTNVDFPGGNNINSQRHGLITPSTVFRSLVDPHAVINDAMGLKQCKMELPSPFAFENNNIPIMPGYEWINELTVNSSAGIFGISPEMHDVKPMVSSSHDSCSSADVNCNITAAVSNSSTYNENHERPSSSAAAPVDLSWLLSDC